MSPLPMNQRWWRSEQRSIFAGVCEGLAEKFDLGPWLVRIVVVLITIPLGSGFFLYIFAALSFPVKSKLHQANDKSVMGVCRNVAIRLNMAPEMVRFITLTSLMLSLGITILLYVILAFTLPEVEDEEGLWR